MSTPAEVVAESFAQARTYANDAESLLEQFTTKLNDALQLAPLVDVSFTPVNDPGAETAPTYTAPGTYSDGVLTSLASVIIARLAGGTGLAPAVESAIWDRARDREAAIAQANIDEVMRANEALGFHLPTGALSAQLRQETRNFYDKVSGLSREIAIKQADLEQSNMQHAIDKAIGYEDVLSSILQRRAQVSVDVFRAEVQAFSAQVEQDVKHWEVQIKQLEAQTTFVFNAQKMNSEIVRANLATVLEAAKTGAQVYAQLTAAAYSLIHASAAVSATASDAVSYSYSNQTTDAVPSVTTI